jgi:choline-sulfatase
MKSEKPNILFIMADQLTAPALPFHGHPVTRAPHLSRLAESGVLFESAYCNSPLCAPSRFSLMAGQLPSRIGAYDNAAEFPASIPTFAHYLRVLGYQTCLAGKMHFVGPDQLHGFEERLTTDIYPSDFGWTPDWEQPEVRPSWYHNMLSVVQAGTAEVTNQLDFDEEVTFRSVRKIYDLARDPDPRPFCLVASFTHPHDPFAITPEYWERYDDEEIDLPIVPPIPVEQLDPHSRRLHFVCALDVYRQTEERVRRARRAYYGMISYIDDKVGQLLAALEATGLRENTIVVFASDHGEMLGERGLWYKMSFFEWSTRVPLLIHAPGLFRARRVHQNVSLIDLLPTFVDLAGGDGETASVDAPGGQSLVPLMRGENRERDTVLGEILGEGAIAPCFMIRRGQYKYIYSEPDPEQLFDLAADPHELRNLAGLPDFEEVRRSLYEEVMERWNPQALKAAVIRSQRRRRLVFEALTQGKHTPWDFQPQADASRQYMRNHLDLNELEYRSRFPAPEVPAPRVDQ